MYRVVHHRFIWAKAHTHARAGQPASSLHDERQRHRVHERARLASDHDAERHPDPALVPGATMSPASLMADATAEEKLPSGTTGITVVQ
jgi:hypothetical protein